MNQSKHKHLGWHSRGYLPHLDCGEILQFVTFRLADSLPQSVLKSRVSIPDRERLRLFHDNLDRGYGSCALRRPEIAQLITHVLFGRHNVEYRLHGWVVMPNHVHVLLKVFIDYPLPSTVKAWKSISARQASGVSKDLPKPFWAMDYFDRYMRDEDHYRQTLHYIEENPVKAGLVSHASEWPYSSYNWRREISLPNGCG